MNREETLKQSDDLLNKLAAALEAGNSEELQKYMQFMRTFHRYSFRNVMLIAMQRPSSTLVAGFNAWKDKGRFVKKGEKGIAILAPMVYKAKKDENDEEKTEKKIKGFRTVFVFDVSQTEGKELPQFDHSVNGDPGERIQLVEELIKSKGIELDYVDSLDGALGVSKGGKIEVLKGLPNGEKFSVLVHELAHELLHRGDRRQDTTKIIRETEAESVAFVVSQAVGLDCSKAVNYIKLWGGSKEILFQSLELIRKVADEIIQAVEVEQPQVAMAA